MVQLKTAYLLALIHMDFGSFHPIMVHFPIVLLTLAVMLDMVQYLFIDKRPSYYAHWLYFGGTAAILPSIITGLFAAESYPESIFLNLHKSMAFFLAMTVLAQVVIRVALLRDKHLVSNKYVVFLSFIIFLIVSLTGDVGGILARGSSPFSSPKHEQFFNYKSADSPNTRSFDPEKLSGYLEKKIDVLDVAPIFAKHSCAKCHTEQFTGDLPSHFSKEFDGKAAWLPRDAEHHLVDWPKSPFYKTTILLNRMPLDENKNSTGISWSERLTLLLWLKNNAPTDVPQPEEEEEETSLGSGM